MSSLYTGVSLYCYIFRTGPISLATGKTQQLYGDGDFGGMATGTLRHSNGGAHGRRYARKILNNLADKLFHQSKNPKTVPRSYMSVLPGFLTPRRHPCMATGILGAWRREPCATATVIGTRV